MSGKSGYRFSKDMRQCNKAGHIPIHKDEIIPEGGAEIPHLGSFGPRAFPIGLSK
jgi:hypothetical protein